MAEDSRPVALNVLVPSSYLGQHRSEGGLADLKRIAPQVVPVQLDQVEGVEEYLVVSALVTDEIERSDAVVITGNRLPVDDAGARAQASQCLDDQWEAMGEIVVANFMRKIMASPTNDTLRARYRSPHLRVVGTQRQTGISPTDRPGARKFQPWRK